MVDSADAADSVVDWMREVVVFADAAVGDDGANADAVEVTARYVAANDNTLIFMFFLFWFSIICIECIHKMK